MTIQAFSVYRTSDGKVVRSGYADEEDVAGQADAGEAVYVGAALDDRRHWIIDGVPVLIEDPPIPAVPAPVDRADLIRRCWQNGHIPRLQAMAWAVSGTLPAGIEAEVSGYAAADEAIARIGLTSGSLLLWGGPEATAVKDGLSLSTAQMTAVFEG